MDVDVKDSSSTLSGILFGKGREVTAALAGLITISSNDVGLEFDMDVDAVCVSKERECWVGVTLMLPEDNVEGDPKPENGEGTVGCISLESDGSADEADEADEAERRCCWELLVAP